MKRNLNNEKLQLCELNNVRFTCKLNSEGSTGKIAKQ